MLIFGFCFHYTHLEKCARHLGSRWRRASEARAQRRASSRKGGSPQWAVRAAPRQVLRSLQGHGASALAGGQADLVVFLFSKYHCQVPRLPEKWGKPRHQRSLFLPAQSHGVTWAQLACSCLPRFPSGPVGHCAPHPCWRPPRLLLQVPPW